MKLKSIALTALFASAAFIGQSASADTITRTTPLITVPDGVGGFNAHYGDTFSAATMGSNFSDMFTFTVGTGFDSAASVTSSYLKSSSVKDLLITGFNLYKYDAGSAMTIGDAIAGVNETAAGAHPTDSWSLSAFGLASGDYAIKVDGTVMGNGGGAFGGDLTIAAVPEPETYGMLLAGLGLVGFMARRRKAA
jgi:hypothetical protein